MFRRDVVRPLSITDNKAINTASIRTCLLLTTATSACSLHIAVASVCSQYEIISGPLTPAEAPSARPPRPRGCWRGCLSTPPRGRGWPPTAAFSGPSCGTSPAHCSILYWYSWETEMKKVQQWLIYSLMINFIIMRTFENTLHPAFLWLFTFLRPGAGPIIWISLPPPL